MTRFRSDLRLHSFTQTKTTTVVLGDIPKVTPSSKVVGDLAQFMVAQNIDASDILDQADTLAFPDSVVNYLKGDIGMPPGGFPEPLRSKVLQSRGLEPIEGRPGQFLSDYDFDKSRELLNKRFGEKNVSEKDLLSYALYPQVFVDWKEFQATYGEVGALPTQYFLNPMKKGDEVDIELGDGKNLLVRLVSISDVNSEGTRTVIFNVNGEPWYIPVSDLATDGARVVREKAKGPGQVGAPMPGVVVGLKVKAGDFIKEGEAVATMSAMKMETSIPANASGKIARVLVNVGDKVEADEMILEIEEEAVP